MITAYYGDLGRRDLLIAISSSTVSQSLDQQRPSRVVQGIGQALARVVWVWLSQV